MTEQLLQSLLRRANHRGLVIARESALTEELDVAQSAFRAALRELEGLKAIEVLSPPPFLALKLLNWSGHRPKTGESRPSAYSYSKLSTTESLKDSYRPGQLDAGAGLLQEILETLGESDADAFRKATEHYSPHVIRTALDRVRRAKSIRKNRTALFRHLLPRIARQSSTNS